MNKIKNYISFMNFVFFLFLSLIALRIIPISETSLAFAQESCLFANNISISFPGSEPESEVIIGINMTPKRVPMPPAPPGFNVFMNINDQSDDIFPSKYKDIKEVSNTTESWLLNITMQEGIGEDYPVLTWNTEDFCHNGVFSLWSSNSDGELFSQRIKDMTEVDNYTITDDDQSYLLVVWSEVIPFQMDFLAGWRMISLPFIPMTTNVSDLFPDAVIVYGFQRGTGYKRVNNLEVGKGYWILFNETKSYELQGQPFSGYAKMIDIDGWSMIGGCTVPAQAATDSCSVSIIYGYKPGEGYKRVTAGENIESGKGYWLLLDGIEGECKLTVNAI